MAETSIPDTPPSRAYTHRDCGGTTVMVGEPLGQLADPFAICTKTPCSLCNKAVKLDRVYWTDTGESIAAFRKRMRREAHWSLKLFGWVIGPLSAALIGFVVAHQFSPNDLKVPIIVATGCAFFVWTTLMPLLVRTFWKIDYRTIK